MQSAYISSRGWCYMVVARFLRHEFIELVAEVGCPGESVCCLFCYILLLSVSLFLCVCLSLSRSLSPPRISRPLRICGVSEKTENRTELSALHAPFIKNEARVIYLPIIRQSTPPPCTHSKNLHNRRR